MVFKAEYIGDSEYASKKSPVSKGKKRMVVQF